MMTDYLTTDPPIQFIEVNGVRLAYRESGTAGKRPMILLHGLAETSAFFWRPLIHHFQADYHIFAFDLLGHGDSDESREGYQPSWQALLFAQAVTRLGLKEAVYIGHSYGGILSTHIAINWPWLVSKLILYDTPLPDSIRKNIVRFIRYTPFRVSLAVFPLAVPLLARTFFRSIPVRMVMHLLLVSWKVHYSRHSINEEFLDQAARHSGNALVETAQASFTKINIIKDLERLNVPTCIIVGDTDLLVPKVEADYWVRIIENAHLVIIENAGHVSLLDNPVAFNQAVSNFLDE